MERVGQVELATLYHVIDHYGMFDIAKQGIGARVEAGANLLRLRDLNTPEILIRESTLRLFAPIS
ncbi:MAG: hypothetical protein OEN48_11235 [Betaproteobacteria bacterium]|nr:hypothetical protein [Betaproteobacteria bacterium]